MDSPMMQAIYRKYDDFMDALFNTAKLLQAKAGRRDILNQLAACENYCRLLHHALTHHPQHLLLDGDASLVPLSDSTPPEHTARRSIRPVEAAEMRRIEEWYAARYHGEPKARPLAIYRAMLPAEEEMGRRRKEPELENRWDRVVTKAIATPRSGSFGTSRCPGDLGIGRISLSTDMFGSLPKCSVDPVASPVPPNPSRSGSQWQSAAPATAPAPIPTSRPATTTSISTNTTPSWAHVAANPASAPSLRPPATTVSTPAKKRTSWAGVAATPVSPPHPTRMRCFLSRGGGQKPPKSRSRGGSSQGGTSWGGNGRGGKPPTLEDTTDSSEGEASLRREEEARDGREFPR